ncbi:heparinase II/III family protein [Burkholderiales bacterium]|nr:heparinase II/III family protein [Burkholderiales bacterium]
MATWALPCEHRQSMVGKDTFIFLNESRQVANKGAWNDPCVEKLWLYNLHYFDDLTAVGAVNRCEWHVRLIERWIDENPPGFGNGWEPYPISLRIVNWIKWALSGGALPPRAIASLAIQIRFLCERLEFHLLGNHLLANAKALIFAGAFFKQEEAKEWLTKGLAILRRELPEQILEDGGHFERSAMYHAIILEDLLDIENVVKAYGLQETYNFHMVVKMRDWLAAMSHPDGRIAFFNDAAFGIAAGLAELNEYAERLRHPVRGALGDGVLHMADSGYVRLQKNDAVLIVDAAPIGPSYLPGHAHADTLSFELSLFGQRVIVNSGTSCYGSSLERQRQRGTAAHNTLVIDGQDSSEVWGGFRVARRAQVKSLNIEEKTSGFCVDASHDGYGRLSGRNLHRRRWLISDGLLVIEDEVTGAFGHAEIRFHLHPDITVFEVGVDSVSLRLTNGSLVTVVIEGVNLVVERTTWHSYFGVVTPNICLTGMLTSPKVRTIINWRENG